MYDKEKIKTAFQRAVGTYEQHDSMQKYAVDVLSEMIKKDVFSAGKILEIGAGSGSLTKIIKSQYADAQYFANDLVDDFSEMYSKIGCTPMMGDATCIDLPNECDMILSANCLQWINDLEAFFARLYQCLKSGGRLFFSTFGEHHFEELKKINGVGLNYFSCAQIQDMLVEAGFKIKEQKEEKDAMFFASAGEMFRYFSLTGVHSVGGGKMWTPRRLASFEKTYKEHFSTADDRLILSAHYVWFSAEK
ncbi:MAG: methyltransferase domain-containing protein [Flavobacteriales bacterium]|nr:methyltransferase domain-containing protein [Flavobacteriales bacterium]